MKFTFASGDRTGLMISPEQGIELFVVAAVHRIHNNSTPPVLAGSLLFLAAPNAFSTRCRARNNRTLRAFSLTL